ncbi:SDR family oxidoreductase [Streptomyces sp. RP5T]|uniref:SDR family NAD(P)-dependent oxidoreductase n=1 Tax=Streptomyces sp. RP5T TaxID=2490848 RepID=UPI000F64648F|nr:SDR family NAD(P)-dependent oxidoreductase [Streptomyces sp. RP5T]RRR79274.1 SDR family NAD(P)-dependent oxidoreductase [Streptomyces sp. RP5T]
MNTKEQTRPRTAVVTGAATGIGAAITERLAGQGMDLVLVARDGARLEAEAKRLHADHGVQVSTLALDLSHPGAPSRLAEWLVGAGTEVDVLVNNAGVSLLGPVAGSDPVRLRGLVDLNAGAVAELTALLLPAMVARGRGAIVNIASTGAYAPAAYVAAYAASKAFVLSFTQAVWAETKATGVRVVAVSPGPTDTAMNTRRVPGKREPGLVADTVMSALRGRGPAVVDGRLNSFQTFVFGRLLPASATARISERAFRKAALGE